MSDLNKNFEIESGFIMGINMKYFNFTAEFAVHILAAIHIGLNEDKNKLFSCDCDYFHNSTLNVELYSVEVLQDFGSKNYSFEYSLKTGFFSFDLVKQFYSTFKKSQEILILVQVNQVCQE
jgi:hypothetical protein